MYTQQRALNKPHKTGTRRPRVTLPATTENLSQALYIINRNAKTSPNPKRLYDLKKRAIQQLLSEGKAKKIGLQFSPNPKNCKQRLDMLIGVGVYRFHLPPAKEDIKALPHLSDRDQSYRNPKANLPFRQAQELLESYVAEAEKLPEKRSSREYAKPKASMGERSSYFSRVSR